MMNYSHNTNAQKRLGLLAIIVIFSGIDVVNAEESQYDIGTPVPSVVVIREEKSKNIPISIRRFNEEPTLIVQQNQTIILPPTLRECQTPCVIHARSGMYQLSAGGLDSGVGIKEENIRVPPGGLGVMISSPDGRYQRGAGAAMTTVGTVAIHVGLGLVLGLPKSGASIGGWFSTAGGIGLLIPGIVLLATNKPRISLTFPLNGALPKSIPND